MNNNYKEIVTKAVIGKSKKSSKDDYNILIEENINQNHLYKSLVESIAISVKKSINEDKYDYGHHAPSSHLK